MLWCVLAIGFEPERMKNNILLLAKLCGCGVVTLVLLAIVLVGALWLHAWWTREVPVIIEIMESPKPTRSSYIPPTSERRRPRSARRGGARRFPAHKRPTARRLNPKQAGHCGYACALAAAGIRPTMAAIKLLRERTAQRIYNLHITNGSVMGTPMRDIVAQSELNLSSYMSGTRASMWASQYEVAIACDLLDTPICLDMGWGRETSGDGTPKFLIKWNAGHFTLHKLLKISSGHVKHRSVRVVGGMIPPPQLTSEQLERLQMGAVTVMEIGATGPRRLPVTLSIDIEPRSEEYMVEYAKFKFKDIINIFNAKHMIARVLGIEPYRINMYNRDDVRREMPIPDWIDAYGDITVVVSPRSDPIPCVRQSYTEVGVQMAGQHDHFIVRVHLLCDHRAFLHKLSSITSIPTQDLQITDKHGEAWTFPDGLRRSHMVMLHPVRRGGMISPTQAFGETDDNAVVEDRTFADDQFPPVEMAVDVNPDQDIQYQDMAYPYWPHDGEEQEQEAPQNDRKRPRSRSPRRATPWDHEDNTLECFVWPRSADVPRPPTLSKPLMLKGERVAQVTAFEEASPADVLAQLHAKVKPIRPLKCLPPQAETWRKVDYVVVTFTEAVRDTYYDLRKWPLEYLRKPFFVPVLHRGSQIDTLILPEEITVQDANRRVTNAPAANYTWMLVVIGDTWTVYSNFLADETRNALENYDYLREENAWLRAREAARRDPDITERDLEAMIEDEEMEFENDQDDDEDLTVTRGGAKRPRQQEAIDPRMAMHAWALDKAERETEGVSSATLSMLLKAEFRTIRAVLSTRQTSQTCAVIAAALRRAGLQIDVRPREQPLGQRQSRRSSPHQSSPSASPSPEPQHQQADQQPQHQQADQQPPHELQQQILQPNQAACQALPEQNVPLRSQMDQLVSLLTTQVGLMDQWFQQTAQQDLSKEYLMMIDVLQKHNQAQEAAIKGLAEAVGAVQEKVLQWETTFLPHIIDRMNDMNPHHTSEASQPESPHGLSDSLPTQEWPEPSTVTVNMGALVPLQDVKPIPVLKKLEDRSLRVQSSKVTSRTGAAMAPFQSKK